MRAPAVAYIALGANLGNAERALHAAVQQIAELPSTQVTAQSSLYRSAPLDAEGPDYLNAAVAVSTRLAPGQLLKALQRIEDAHGRARPYPNAPRTLDLDILLYGDARIDTPTLTVPHPRMLQRAFVLHPLAEIAPQRVSGAMLCRVADQRIEKIDSASNRTVSAARCSARPGPAA